MLNFSIAREQLHKALRIISGVVERKQATSPVFSNALFVLKADQLVITASDQDVELTYAVPVMESLHGDASALLPFKKIFDVCRAIPEDKVITICVEGDKATIVAGRSRFVLSTLVAEQFPKIQHSSAEVSINIARSTLLELVARTAFSMAEQDVRYFLNGLFFEINGNQIKAIAADGHRLVLHTVGVDAMDMPHRTMIVPRKGVLEIARALQEGANSVDLIISNNNVRLLNGDFELVSKLIEGRFPDYRTVIPRGGDKVVIGNREILKEAFARAAALLSDKVRGIILRIKPGNMQISANSAENDVAEDEVEIEYSGEELEIGFNVRYLIEFMTIATAEQIRFTFSGASSSVLIEELQSTNEPTGNGVYVIMPMRA